MRSSSFLPGRGAGSSRPRVAFVVAALCAAVLLPACSVLPKAEPLDVYVLPMAVDTSATGVSAARETLRASALAPASRASATVPDRKSVV